MPRDGGLTSGSGSCLVSPAGRMWLDSQGRGWVRTLPHSPLFFCTQAEASPPCLYPAFQDSPVHSPTTPALNPRLPLPLWRTPFPFALLFASCPSALKRFLTLFPFKEIKTYHPKPSPAHLCPVLLVPAVNLLASLSPLPTPCCGIQSTRLCCNQQKSPAPETSGLFPPKLSPIQGSPCADIITTFLWFSTSYALMIQRLYCGGSSGGATHPPGICCSF